jgi:CHAD domain-containing protein
MKALNRYAEKRFNRLKWLLKSFPDAEDKENLHQIRLEIKRIKAILRLIHFNNHHFRDHKHYIPLRTIFRDCGKIRDVGLRKELLEQYTQIHTPFFRSTSNSLNLFMEAIPDHLRAVNKKRKIILKEVQRVKARTYHHYLRMKGEELAKLLAEGIHQKDLHGLRKLIKEITYLTTVEKKKDQVDPFLTKSSELIGNWHDKKILIPWIRSHAAKEKATIIKLQMESNTDLQNLRKLVRVVTKPKG